MNDFWDQQTVIGEVERGERNKIVIAQAEKKGKHYVDIRNWYAERNTTDFWMPGKGISIPVEFFSDVLELLQKVSDR